MITTILFDLDGTLLPMDQEKFVHTYKGLLTKKTGRIKVLAGGMLHKPLTIKAENYSVQAIKMIELTGGTVIILKDDVEKDSNNE